MRTGSARAVDRFDLIVAAPGSLNDVLFSVIYLNPSAVKLLDPAVTLQFLDEPRADFTAPIGFCDSTGGDPVVGTIAPLSSIFRAGWPRGGCSPTLRRPW